MKNRHEEFLKKIRSGMSEPRTGKADFISAARKRTEQEKPDMQNLQEELERKLNELFGSFDED